MATRRSPRARLALDEAEYAGIQLADSNIDKALAAAQQAGQPIRLRITLAFYKGQPKGYTNASGYVVGGLQVAPREEVVKALWQAVELAIQKSANAQVGPAKVCEVLEAL